jgi:hypothetical protein
MSTLKRKWPSLTILLLAISGNALAGRKLSSSVVVAASFAQGSLGAARNSSDINQQIGCAIQAISGGYKTQVSCAAHDAAGHIGGCTSDDPVIIQAVSFIRSDSYLSFSWDSNKTCTMLNVWIDSAYEPKQ